MTANDWLIIQRARAHRDGLRRGAALAVLPAAIIGALLMFAMHLGMNFALDQQHDETVRLLSQERDTCRADVARYKEIADLEKAYANRRAE